MIRRVYKDKRNKAFVGAIIGAVGNLANGIMSGINAKKQAKREEQRLAQEAEYEKNSLNNQIERQQEANRKQQKIIDNTAYRQNNLAVSNLYNNMVHDNYNEKLEYKCGGKTKRKKAKLGLNDFVNIGTSTANVAGSLISGIMTNKANNKISEAQQKYSHINDDLKEDLLDAQAFMPEQRNTISISPIANDITKENYNNIPVNTKYNYDQMELAKLGIRKRKKIQ